ncbi:DUF2835 family protein [Pleionea mediterranea]|uniref:DUF2835 family protein n=1 Tax=Pleionea mediterranea TaxID=523701 RepID=UPI000D6C8DE1
MHSYILDIHITADEWLKIYRGYSSNVRCRATDGTRILLPAKHFKSFVTRNGVSGRFQLIVTSEFKFVSISLIN